MAILNLLLIRLASSFKYKLYSKEENILFISLIVSILLYFSAIIEQYLVFKYIIYFTLVFVSLYFLFKKKVNLDNSDLLLFTTLIIVYYFSKSLVLYNWDDFTHWGVAVKYIGIFNKLPTDPTIDVGASYIPGMSLWIDWLNTSGSNSENSWLAASAAMLVFYIAYVSSAVIKRIESVHNSKVTAFIALGLVMYAYMYLVNQSFYIYSLLSDVSLGVLFGLGLMSILIRSFRYSFLVLMFSVVNLMLTKHTGLVFSIQLIFIWTIHNLVNNKEKINKTLLLSVLSMLVVYLVKISWDKFVLINNITTPFNEKLLNVSSIFHILTQYKSDQLLMKIIEQIRNNFYLLPLVQVVIKGILIISIISVLFKKWDDLLKLFYFIFSYVSYMLFLILCYRFLFTDYEALRIASFGRYIDTLNLGWSIFIVLWGYCLFISILKSEKIIHIFNEVLLRFKNTNIKINSLHTKYFIKIRFIFNSKLKIPVIFISILILLFIQIKQGSEYVYRDPTTRNFIINESAKIKSKVKPTEKVYTIWQQSQGLEVFQLKYELLPIISSYQVWSLGTPFNDKDVWTTNLTDQEFIKLISSYDYVYIGNASDSLWKIYGHFFNIHESGLFKVTKENSIKLIKI